VGLGLLEHALLGRFGQDDLRPIVFASGELLEGTVVLAQRGVLRLAPLDPGADAVRRETVLPVLLKLGQALRIEHVLGGELHPLLGLHDRNDDRLNVRRGLVQVQDRGDASSAEGLPEELLRLGLEDVETVGIPRAAG